MVSVLHISGASLGEAGSLGYQMGHSSWNSSLLEVATQASGRGGQLLAGNCGPECPYTVSSRHCDLGYLHGNSELWYPCSREPATSCIAFFHLVLEVVWQKLRSISSAVLCSAGFYSWPEFKGRARARFSVKWKGQRIGKPAGSFSK